jgi:hypothetical protein
VRSVQQRRRRARAQWLHRPGSSSPAWGSPREVGEVVGRLLAVQAQDLRSARLALRARGRGLVAGDVDTALSVDRSLVMGWLFRGTLHLVRSEDYLWLFPLTAPVAAQPNRRRLGQEGVSPDQAEAAVEIVREALEREGPLLRAELGERLASPTSWGYPQAEIPTRGQALPHLLLLAFWRGVAVLGPVRAEGQAFVSPRDWLGEAPGPPSEEARASGLAELGRRYLAGHEPADAEDLAAWSGLPLRDARTALGGPRWTGGGAPPAPVPPRLLPAFDPYLLGWRDRSFAVPPEHARRVHPGGGVLRATATVDGTAVGTWTARRSRGRLAVTIDPFAPLPARAAKALAAEADDVARFEGLEGSVTVAPG